MNSPSPRYIPHTEDDVRQMLAAIGVADLDALFASVPEKLRLARPLAVPRVASEQEVAAELAALAARNANAGTHDWFLGAGTYAHYAPAAIDSLVSRAEFTTAYTPYQPEISQGTLQTIFEWQTMICGLTGLEVSNASLYDGASATAEAVLMAMRLTRRRKVVIANGLHPHYGEVLDSYVRALDVSIATAPRAADGRSAPLDALVDDATACVVVQQPSFLGSVQDLAAIGAAARARGALFVVVVNEALSLGLLRAPGDHGADIVCGEAQSFGVPMGFGGPALGFLATRERHVRQMPGRLCGQTVDARGKRGFVLTLSTREQHIRREKATSNICTNQGLCLLIATVYLSLLGRVGLAKLARLNFAKAEYLKQQIRQTPGLGLPLAAPTFNEFVVSVPDAGAALARALDAGIVGGLDLSPYAPELGPALLVCVTELANRDAIDKLVRVLAREERVSSERGRDAGPEQLGHATYGLSWEEPLLFERSRAGRVGYSLPDADVPVTEPESVFEAGFLRDDLPALPELSEVDVVRHFTRISTWNAAVDLGLYPLGSCTMKYNPKINEWAARLPGFARIHPLQPVATAQGMLELCWRLEQALAEVSGMDRVSLQPAAGAQGELAGIMMIRAYHEHRGEKRHIVLVPDSAHGTNPASAALNDYQVVTIPSGRDGILHPEAVANAMTPDVAALMITNPNTLGLFETHIAEICDLVHAHGGLVYGDGANLNALLGIARPGDLGIDVMHFNLHKTFSTPHGGGGPGAGPVGVKNILAPYLPVPVVTRRAGSEGEGFGLDWEFPRSIGRLHANFGNVGMFVRAWAYLRSLGPDGLRRCAEMAVLNANYLLARLRDAWHVPIDRQVMHECVLSDKNLESFGVTTLDVAKRLIDYGYHPPTVYFPLIVHGSIMIEPTESESLEGLDRFAEAMLAIAEEARTDPEHVRTAPHRTRLARLDETRAARKPVLRWQQES